MDLSTARLRALLRLFPAIQLFTLVDTVLLLVYFWPDVDHTLLVSWSTWSIVHCAFWWAYSTRPHANPRPLLIHAVSEALLFSVLMVLVFPIVSSDKAVVLGAFATGMLAAGALSKMTMPIPSLTFTVILTLGTDLAMTFSHLPMVWVPIVLMTAFGVALAVLARAMSEIFDARVLAELELERQKTLVSLLLEDFEASASEGLWESDASGRLTFASPRLVELLGVELDGREEWAPLLQQGKAFRHQVIPVQVKGLRRWWSLTGKPLTDERGKVTRWRGVGSDITGLREQELEMMRMSRFDSLTGLLNRHAFRQLIDGVFGAEVTQDRFLVLIDLVGFRNVNESRGHLFGDDLLQAVATRLKAEVAETWTLARLDGDEFAMQWVVRNSLEESRSNLSRLMEVLTEPYTIGVDRYEAAFRLGAALAPSDAQSADQWLRCADLALRSAKVKGRNAIAFFTQDLMQSFVEHNQLRELLRGAVTRGEISVMYQPLIDLKRGLVVGFEALARWNSPERGSISPAVFIPLAEETGCILGLGLWVLEKALREAKNWPVHLHLSVNVSGVQLASPGFANEALAAVERVGFSAMRLILELTESALIRNDDMVGKSLRKLKDAGIRLALDDFGTGYSALSYLQHFPFDKLKIDQSFVRPLGTEAGSPALLGAIVRMARSLGLSVTVEGIETLIQRELLKALDCDDGQGYLFSPPLLASALRDFIEEAS